MGEKMVTTSNWICSCLCTLDENTILLFVKDETLALYYFKTNPCFFKGEEFNYAKQDFESSKTINENIGERNVGEKLAGTLYWISCFFEQEQHVAFLTCDTLIKQLHITNSQSIKVVRDRHNFCHFCFFTASFFLLVGKSCSRDPQFVFTCTDYGSGGYRHV